MTKEYIERLTQFITAAFALAAGLAWNDAIQGLIRYFLPADVESFFIQFLYAVVLTFIAVFVTKGLSNWSESKDKQKDKDKK